MNLGIVIEKLNLQKHNYGKICRICLQTGLLRPIFRKKSFQTELSEIIMECCSIQIKRNDGLPSNICEKCHRQIISMNNFRKICRKTQGILLYSSELLNSSERKPDKDANVVLMDPSQKQKCTFLSHYKEFLDKKNTDNTTLNNEVYYVDLTAQDIDLVIDENKMTMYKDIPECASMTSLDFGSLRDDNSTAECEIREALSFNKKIIIALDDITEQNNSVFDNGVEFLNTPTCVETDPLLEITNNKDNFNVHNLDHTIIDQVTAYLKSSNVLRPSDVENLNFTLVLQKTKTYKCEYCKKKFISEETLNQHTLRKHPKPNIEVVEIVESSPTPDYVIEEMGLLKLENMHESFYLYDLAPPKVVPPTTTVVPLVPFLNQKQTLSVFPNTNHEEIKKPLIIEVPDAVSDVVSLEEKIKEIRQTVVKNVPEILPFLHAPPVEKLKKIQETVIKKTSERKMNEDLKIIEKQCKMKNTKFHCEKCNLYFKCMNHLSKHLRGRYHFRKCKICKKLIANEKFEEHIFVEHTLNQLICSKCGELFTSKKERRNHFLAKHYIKKVYRCNVCSKISKNKYAHAQHMLRHSSERRHECNICGKRIKNRDNLKRHMAMHSNDKKYECSICGTKHIQKVAMQKHQELHLNQLNCLRCRVVFNDIETLKLHVSINTCEIKRGSQYRFPRQESDTRLCELCGKQVACSGLKTHLKRHSEVTSYKCKVCDKDLTNKSNLRVHMRTHTKEKPYECNICHKRFAYNLYSHMRTHSKEKQYKCNLCNREIKYLPNLRKHYKVKHNVVLK